VAGNLRFWVIFSERFYLFGLEANRDAFAADPVTTFSARMRAGQRWSRAGSIVRRLRW
jgi:hypothetical protein